MMDSLRKSLVLSALILLVLMTQDVLARDGGPPPPNKRRERIESVIIGKFVNELELTPEQAQLFFPKFRVFRGEGERIMREQNELRRELDDLSNSKSADSQDLNQLLDQREQNQQSGIRLKRAFLTEISEFLTPQQVSRCSVLLDDLPVRIQALIQEERQRQQRRGESRGFR